MSAFADVLAMEITGWQERLAAAIEAAGMTKRGVSLAAGQGPGYVHSILQEGKDPSVSNLAKVCNVVGVSLAKVLYGLDLDQETEELVRYAQGDPDLRKDLIAVLRRGVSKSG